MMKFRMVAPAALALIGLSVVSVRAEDVSAKKVAIKDNADPTKRQVQAQSTDTNVEYSEADDPGTNGASVHAYSATDNFCVILPADGNWDDTGTVWKYKNKATKNSAQIGDGKLKVKIKSGVTYTLAEGSQGTVNVQVQFGAAGTRYCMKCTVGDPDDTKKFIGKNCVAAVCDAEPPGCDPVPTTTTSTTTTTTNTLPPGPELLGALTPSNGRFNYNLTLGLPGANAACNSNFPGTHACVYSELLIAELLGELVGLQDTASATVTSFWVLDGSLSPQRQCIDDTVGGSNLNWEYNTAHTGTFAQKVDLTNGTGDLGPSYGGPGGGGANCIGTSSVGCCL
jgi:hypothetical protein